MMEWEKVKIGDLCEVGRGSSPRPITDERYFSNGNIPWIKIADATKSGKYLYITKEYVNDFGASYSRILRKGSLIIAASGVSLGQIQLLGVDGCIHDGWLYISNYKANLDKDYLYYLLKLKGKEFHNYSSGAAIQNINTEILRNLKIALPPIFTQKKIAHILSTYDDLIENNQKRIAILEKMAQNLYQEWFVRFRFPDWEKVEFVEGLPKGWEKVKLKTLSTYINRGITPKYDENGDSLVINQRCIRNNGLNIKVARKQTKAISQDKIIQFGDVLVNSTGTGTLGRVAQVMERLPLCTVDSHVTIVRGSDKVNIDYWGYLLMNQKVIFENLAIGATNQTELPREDIGLIKVLFPPIHLQNQFSKIVHPLRNQVTILKAKNQILQQTRDRLLPRLLSGKLEV